MQISNDLTVGRAMHIKHHIESIYVLVFLRPDLHGQLEEDNFQPREVRTWSSAIPAENVDGYLSSFPNDDIDDDGDQPPEARAWSSYQATNLDNVLGEGPTRQQKLTTFQSARGQQRTRQDPRGVEQVLSYIDKNRPPRQTKYRLTWRTFIGTMPGMEQIYARDDFLRYYEEFRPLFVFMDSVFRGISQVMFANNPISGIIITIGLLIGNWELGLYAMLGTCASTFTAHILGFNYNSIRAGLYGYNGCLTAMGIAYFNFPRSPQLIPPIVLMSCFSTIFAAAVGKVLVQKLELSPFTFSFQISTWIWLLGSIKYRYFFLDGNILSPTLLRTLTEKPQLSNISYATYSVEDNFVGFFASIAQVYFIDNPYTGAIILVGVCLCSRILSFFALFGAVTAQLSAAYLLGLPSAAIHAGLWGYNSVLTCQALGGMFFVLHGYRIWLFTFLASVMTVLVQAAVSSFLSACGMPTLTFPFTVICWIFCLIAGSKDLIAVKLAAVSIPEDHRRRFNLSRLVKTQFQFLSYLTNLSSGEDEITWQDLLKIQAEFIPIIVCSYAYRGDLTTLKILKKQNINIQSTDQNLRSPLHISAAQGDMKLCKWLVDDMKINTNTVDKFGGTPLYEALWNGHLHLLPFLYSRGARLPACKAKELAFYMNTFVAQGDLDAIELLIDCGFNPNTGDYDGRNALHIAVMCNRFDIVCYLVEETQIWLDITDYYRQTAVNYASNLSDMTISHYLLQKINSNHNPLSISREHPASLQVIVEKGIEQKSKIKVAKVEEPTVIDGEESVLPTLFCMVAAQADTNKMSDFLDQYPTLNPIESVNYDLRTAAHVAAASGQLESIRFLEKYCNRSQFEKMMNREDRWGLSPLDEAYRHGHRNIAEFYKKLMNEEQTDEQSSEFTHQSNMLDDSDMPTTVDHLLRKGRKVFLFCTLAAAGESERIDGLFKRKYFIKTESYADYHGRTPMHFAVVNGHLNVVQILIHHGYDCISNRDRWGSYPIDEARRRNYDLIIEQLTQLKM